MDGTIARLIADKGFGFIRAQNGTEFFFHMSAVRGQTFAELQKDQPVQFDEEQSEKGPRATNVRVSA